MDTGKKSSPFKPFSRQDWIDAAKLELGGKNNLEKLIHSVEGLNILPYYDAADLPAQPAFRLPRSKKDFTEPRNWCNMPRIVVKEVTQANEQALHALNHGADGILFELTGDHHAGPLLKNIEWSSCQVAFLAGNGQEAFLNELARLPSIEPSQFAGVYFWKHLPENPAALVAPFNKWEKFHVLGILAEESHSTIDALAMLLWKAAKQIENGNTQFLTSIAFSISVGNDFFLEIAKIKTLRALWYQVTQAFSPGPFIPLYLHAFVQAATDPRYEPHYDLLKATPAALSAILGGCDAITIDSIDPEDKTMASASRHVSTLLREESHVGKVADPTAGSYFLEQMIDELSQQVWRKFQELSAS